MPARNQQTAFALRSDRRVRVGGELCGKQQLPSAVGEMKNKRK